MKATAYIMAATASVALTGTIILIHIARLEVKQFLTSITGHHWTAVSAILAISFGLMLLLVHAHGLEEEKGLSKADDLLGWSIALIAVTLAMTLGTFALHISQYRA